MAEDQEQVKYKIEIDNKEVITALKQIQQEIKDLGAKSDRELEKVNKSLLDMGSLFNKGNVAVVALGATIVSMAKDAIEAIAGIVTEAKDLQAELENNRIVFTNMFGDQDLALGFMDNMREQAIRLGQSYSSVARFAKAILPDTENMEQFNELLEIAAAGARDANLPLEQLVFSFNELVSGDFKSIRDRLDIPKDVIARIKESANSIGIVQASINEIGALLEKRGVRDIDSFADSYMAASNRVGGSLEALKIALGDPIFDTWKEGLQETAEILKERAPEFEKLAEGIGHVIAEIVEFIQSGINDFLENLDVDKVWELIEAGNRLVQAIRLVVQVFFGMNAASDEANDTIAALIWVVDRLAKALVTLAQWATIIKINFKTLIAELYNMANAIGYTVGLVEKLNQMDVEALRSQWIEDATKPFDDYQKNLDETNKKLEETKEKTEDATEAEMDFSKSKLAGAQAAEKAKEKEAELADARAKITAAMEKESIRSQRALEDIMIDYARKKLELEQKIAEKTEEIQRKAAERLVDLANKYKNKRLEILIDEGEDVKNEAKDLAFDLTEIDIKTHQKKADEELRYRQKLKEIEDEFNLDVEDTARKRDAVAYLRLVRENDRKMAVAKEHHEQNIQEIDTDATRAKEERQRNHEQELIDIKDKTRERLEAAKRSYAEEIKAAAAKYKEEKQELSKYIADEKAQLKQWLAEKLEDNKRAEKRRLEDIRRSLAEELKMFGDNEKKKTAIALSESAKRSTGGMEGEGGGKGGGPKQQSYGTYGSSVGRQYAAVPHNPWSEGLGHYLGAATGSGGGFQGWEGGTIRLGSGRRRRSSSSNQSSGGGGGGSSHSSSGSVLRRLRKSFGISGYAAGGQMTASQVGLVGEKGPELFSTNQGAKIFSTDKLEKLVAGKAMMASEDALTRIAGAIGTRMAHSRKGEAVGGQKGPSGRMMYAPASVTKVGGNRNFNANANFSLLPKDMFDDNQLEQIEDKITEIMQKVSNRAGLGMDE